MNYQGVEKHIESCCSKYNIDLKDIKSRYNEPHRHYHNWNHILDLFTLAEYHHHLDGIIGEQLAIAILFHDIVYDPKRTDSERKSAEYMKEQNLWFPDSLMKEVSQAIINTATHSGTFALSKMLNEIDMQILYTKSFEKFVNYEKNIFKEYQYVNCSKYKIARIEFLENNDVSSDKINYVRYREPNIAVYAGSFNPFHKGHLNIIQKAERIFDKVIIARGTNPEKSSETVELPSVLNYHQIDYYNGLLTDYLKSLNYPVTLIRGLRDANDLLYESNQISFLKELMPDIKVIEIICDKEFSHISSSAIRNLEKFNKKEAEKYLC